MYELIILSLLMQFPAHGYLISKTINTMIGPYAKVSNGRLYPLLSKLEKDGLIAASNETTNKDERHLCSYKITKEGHKRFYQVMMDTISNPGDYQKFFLYKATNLKFLKPPDRLHLIDHYIHYCQSHILHLHRKLEYLVDEVSKAQVPSSLDGTLGVIQHLIDQWQLELNWVKELEEQELIFTKVK